MIHIRPYNHKCCPLYIRPNGRTNQCWFPDFLALIHYRTLLYSIHIWFFFSIFRIATAEYVHSKHWLWCKTRHCFLQIYPLFIHHYTMYFCEISWLNSRSSRTFMLTDENFNMDISNSCRPIIPNKHFNDVIIGAYGVSNHRPHICFLVYSGADQRKHRSSASLSFEREFTGHRWIPHTNGQ